jgi:ParB family chromosome partitioning protein
MKLEFVSLDKLSVSRANMRFAKKPPDVSDILPTVRARGILTPLIVRAQAGADAASESGECPSGTGFEIVAGRRRFHAARQVADERRAAGDSSAAEPLPCAILDSGDDADAVEASLIENIARLDPDEVSQWETFTRLIREGRCPDDIAATFGLPERAVKRVLALGNLLPRIRDLYRHGEIDRTTVRHLTLATKAQQKSWLALALDPDAYAPMGHQLKAWLFGGHSIPVGHALFDVAASGLAIVADLFGEDSYFADADAFWSKQIEAVEAKRQAYLEAGWPEAVIVPAAEHFQSWDYERAPKRKCGRVYLDLRANGEIVVHEGLIGRREAQRLARGESEPEEARPARPEITAAMQTYLDLHRHAAVRAALVRQPGAALRLLIAHAITGSPCWTVRPEPQTAKSETTRESVAVSLAEAAFDERRRAVLALLGFSPEEPTVIGGNTDGYGLVALFHRLVELPDAAVLDVAAIVIGESLAAGSAAVEALGHYLNVRMHDWWQADEAFFEQVRDREVLTCLVAEVAGRTVADANAKESGKVLKMIIRDHLAGANGRPKVEHWGPKWMAFPPDAYTARGGVGTVSAHAIALAALERDRGPAADAGAPVGTDEPEPDAAALIDGDGPDAKPEADTLARADDPEQDADTGSGGRRDHGGAQPARPVPPSAEQDGQREPLAA